jgi:hypothetical protein
MRFWTTDRFHNDLFDSAPWPLPGHPEAMKTEIHRNAIFTPGWQALILQRHFALPSPAASILGTLQRSLTIFATY